MSSAPPAVALSAIRELMSLYVSGALARNFEQLSIPVVAVSADMWPIDYEANRRHMVSFDAIVLNNTGHFLMMNRPDDFNTAMEQAIDMIANKQAR